jgi:CDGSH-type Zn-finger protein
VSDQSPKITIRRDGPYVVSGSVPLAKQAIIADENGACVAWREGEGQPVKPVSVLCRCGGSETKPYCDGTHVEIGFDGTETADRTPCRDRADVIEGPMLTLTDAADLCGEARFCDAHGGLWNRVAAADTPELCAAVVEQTALCPTGRYVVWDKETGEAFEPVLEQSIGLVEDPQMGVSGGLWVRGGIPIEAADGDAYEIRNRVTLCRCGASKNKPFCDGTHLEIRFTDEG